MVYEWSAGILDWLDAHGIEAYEVMQVLLGDRRWPQPAQTDAGLVLTVWGRTKVGRHLIVTLRPDANPYDWWIGPARDMTTDEITQYARWEADHDQH